MNIGSIFANLFGKKHSSKKERFETEPTVRKARNRVGILDSLFRRDPPAKRFSRYTKAKRIPRKVKAARKNQRRMHKIAACRPA